MCKIVKFILQLLLMDIVLNVGIRAQVELNEEDYNDTWMYMPDGDGKPQVAYLVEPPPEDNRNKVPKLVQFEYYGGSNPDTPVINTVPLEDNEVFNHLRVKRDSWEEMAEKFNPKLDTKILVHGWKSSTQSNSIQSIRGAYMQKGHINVFGRISKCSENFLKIYIFEIFQTILAINWRDQADNIYYLRPARYTVQVGRAVAKLIDLLVEEKGADPMRIHLIGHSLGSHIMGYAGSYTKYRVGRITGLDPARPAFEDCIGPENHLDRTDAEFVDVIHSCAGFLGFKNPIGHVDFYPNGGHPPQPGCTELSQIFIMVDHMNVIYYAESINSEKGFYATPCTSLFDIKGENCTGTKILMGDRVPKTAEGIYYLKTASKPAFALGME
ncbi:Inactive pancreatic lipase-related protein 1 [Lucilia cuprina]|nr:Inactive pancreatic lipase-related protein 1 [Lucilia cuprina]